MENTEKIKSLREEVIHKVSPLIGERALRKIYPLKRRELTPLQFESDPGRAIAEVWISVGDNIRFAMKKYARSKK